MAVLTATLVVLTYFQRRYLVCITSGGIYRRYSRLIISAAVFTAAIDLAMSDTALRGYKFKKNINHTFSGILENIYFQ